MEFQNLDLNHIDTLLEINDKEHQFVKDAIQFLMKFLPLYSNEEVYVSFNGGKDATVVLILTYLAKRNLEKINQKDNQQEENLQQNEINLKTVYFVEENSFQEVDNFIQQMKDQMKFQQIELKRNFKESMRSLVSQNNLKAVIMGSRRGDPYCDDLERISPSDTDKGYPPFLRVNPIMYWNYEQVWKFLIDFKIPYCCLYSQGYSYLGNQNNTQKNPQLLEQDQKVYKHAKYLKGEFEQLSRQK